MNIKSTSIQGVQPGFILLATFFLSASTLRSQEPDTSKVIAKGANLQLISDQFKFTEGPAIDKQGNIYFTDQPNDKIWIYATDGKLSVFMNKTGRSNGLYFDKEGNLVACADEKFELWRISPGKKVTILCNEYKGQKLNGPNDLWIDAKGGIYITDPYYQRPYWTRKKPELAGENLYYLAKGKKELVIVDDNFKKPNGIVGTPDGKYLYVSDIGDNKTYRFEIRKDGTLAERKLFVEQGSDGMTIDNMGNVYLTGDGVTVYNAEGKKIEHITVPAKWTANVCFAGKQKNKLFITASESVFIIDMKVKGAQ
jgi:gluconolactonase